MENKKFHSLGSCPIWLRGSRRTYWRVVRQYENGQCFVVLWGALIEVKHGSNCYYTVEDI